MIDDFLSNSALDHLNKKKSYDKVFVTSIKKYLIVLNGKNNVRKKWWFGYNFHKNQECLSNDLRIPLIIKWKFVLKNRLFLLTQKIVFFIDLYLREIEVGSDRLGNNNSRALLPENKKRNCDMRD